MSEQRLAEFLNGPRNAIMATVRRSGPPQLSPVWYLYEERRFHVPIVAGSAKYRNIKRDPRVSLCIDGGFPDLRAVMADGEAVLVEDSHGADRFRHICRRYYASEVALARASEIFEHWGRVATVVVAPKRFRTQDYSGWDRA